MPEPPEHLAASLADRYRIERELGAGGMATVFLANDIRHDRLVAIKVLKPELAAVIGAGRFLREIKTIASLQHPHILGLIDSGEVNGTAYYVMPFIDGESLRDRLDREKQIPVPDAVRLTGEIAGALDYAHRHNVIHRDIKPENILLHDGGALIADFGIALALSKAGGTRMTETGMSLGTPQYMSPEQAMGERDIGPQSDVYSLGAVTYEMLAGEPPFTGPTAQAIVARIITDQPRTLTARRRTIPQHVESAVLTALEKLPADRFASTKDFADALNNPAYVKRDNPTPTTSSVSSQRWKWTAIAACTVALIAAVASVTQFIRPKPSAAVMQYAITFPAANAPNSGIILSRDGSRLVYGRIDSIGRINLWVKERDQLNPTRVQGAEDIQAYTLSPDGKWIAMIQRSRLRKLLTTGGAPVDLADSVFFGGLAWLDDGSIIYTTNRFQLMRLKPDGTVSMLRAPDGRRAPVLMAPLPDSRGVLFTLCNAACSNSDLFSFDIESNRETKLVAGAIQGWYLPTGHLAYVGHDRQMLAVPFDVRSAKMGGNPVRVLSGISLFNDIAPIVTISQTGTMIFQTDAHAGTASGNSHFVWIDRTGRRTELDSTWSFRLAQPEANHGWSLSPDGRRLVMNFTTSSGDDIWTKELPDGAPSRLTFDSASEFRPRWTVDGKSVTYIRRSPGTLPSGALLQRRVDGTGDVETLIPDGVMEGIRTNDGWAIVRTGGEVGGKSRDILGMRIGVDSSPRPLVANPGYNEMAASLSPDGKWLAYESDETGTTEIYVRLFPNVDGGKWQVSTNGGSAPLWAHSGRELFFVDGNRQMIAASVNPGATFGLSARRTLFPISEDLYFSDPELYTPFDISPDDTRFLMVRQDRSAKSGETTFVLVENWFETLKAQMKGAR